MGSLLCKNYFSPFSYFLLFYSILFFFNFSFCFWLFLLLQEVYRDFSVELSSPNNDKDGVDEDKNEDENSKEDDNDGINNRSNINVNSNDNNIQNNFCTSKNQYLLSLAPERTHSQCIEKWIELQLGNVSQWE